MDHDAPTSAVVFAGGDPIDVDILEDLPGDALIIAADSGLDHARSLGLHADLLIGDMDSVSPEALREAGDAAIEIHPRDKNRTDLDLALHAALRFGVERIIVVGGAGGRVDHFLANALLLASKEFADVDVEWLTGAARVHIIHQAARLHCTPGNLLTLLAIHGPAYGIRTRGLRWELEDATLEPGSTWGVSNEFVKPVATVRVEEGTVLAVMPSKP